MIFRGLILYVLFLCSVSVAQEIPNDSLDMNSGIVYGKDHAFSITAPTGWVLDNQSGVNQGLHAVFYHKGGSWDKSESVMYVNTAHKDIEGNETVEKLISYDVSQFKKNSPSIEIEDSPIIVTFDNKEVIVKKFFDDKNYEAVGYLDEKKVVVILVLTSRDKQDFEESLSAFEELVKSYYLISEDVEFNQ